VEYLHVYEPVAANEGREVLIRLSPDARSPGALGGHRQITT
jgi:hypothetical protein